MPTPRTPADLIAEGPGLLSRLGRHLGAVERGEEGAGDDLAAVLRILIDSTDKGNRGMVRLAAALGISLPQVMVSGSPDLSAPGLLLSFGNLPVVPAPGDGLPHTPRYLPFEAWLDTPSLIVPSSQKRRESWGSFATLIANTGGSHLSTVYHDLLVTSDLFDAVGLSLRDYLLRQVGWQVERVLADLLARTGRLMLPRTRRLDYWPRMPIWMLLKEPGPGKVDVVLGVNVNSDDLREVEVIRFDRHGKTYHLFHNGGDPNSGGLQIRLVIDDPETGERTTADGAPAPPGWKMFDLDEPRTAQVRERSGD